MNEITIKKSSCLPNDRFLARAKDEFWKRIPWKKKSFSIDLEQHSVCSGPDHISALDKQNVAPTNVFHFCIVEDFLKKQWGPFLRIHCFSSHFLHFFIILLLEYSFYELLKVDETAVILVYTSVIDTGNRSM